RAVDRYRRAIAKLAADEIDRDELADTRTAKPRALSEGRLARGGDVARAAAADEEPDEAEIIDLLEALEARLPPDEREPARGDRGATRDDDLEGRSRAELYERAKALGVPGRSKMSKDELVRALREAGG